MRTLIRNGLAVTREGIAKQDILISDGRIERIGADAAPSQPGELNILDATGCFVLPGLVDAHVHFNMLSGSGYTHDGFERGTLGAVRGGVTSVIDFARPIPGEPPSSGLRSRISEAEGNCHADFALHMSMQGWYANGGVSYEQLKELADMGVSSLKFFTTYGAARIVPEALEAMLPDVKRAGLLPMIHAESDAVCAAAAERLRAAGRTAPRHHGEARPIEAEILEIRYLISLAERFDMPMYIAHVSTGGAAELIRAARARGLRVMGETCPHYLVRTEDVYGTEEAALALASPPLRSREDSLALFEALRDGSIQCVSSDHCAFSREAKLSGSTCFDTPAGLSGVETILPIMYTYGVAAGRMGMEEMVRAVSTNPAEIFGLEQKGELARGRDADIVIFDPNVSGTLRAAGLVSRSGYCIFENMEHRGAVRTVLLRGREAGANGSAQRAGRYIECKAARL